LGILVCYYSNHEDETVRFENHEGFCTIDFSSESGKIVLFFPNAKVLFQVLSDLLEQVEPHAIAEGFKNDQDDI